MTLSDVSFKKGTGYAMPCSLNRIFLVMYRCSQTHKMNAEQEEWIFGEIQWDTPQEYTPLVIEANLLSIQRVDTCLPHYIHVNRRKKQKILFKNDAQWLWNPRTGPFSLTRLDRDVSQKSKDLSFRMRMCTAAGCLAEVHGWSPFSQYGYLPAVSCESLSHCTTSPFSCC